MKINANDILMMRCLHDDARMSIAQISKNTGVPESTVRNRLGKLIDSGVVDFVALTDPLKLGYQFWIMMEIETEPTKVNDVAQQLCGIPEVYFVALTTGGYKLVVSASFRSNADHLNFITDRLPRIAGITRTATYNLLKIYKRQMNILPPVDELVTERDAEEVPAQSGKAAPPAARQVPARKVQAKRRARGRT